MSIECHLSGIKESSEFHDTILKGINFCKFLRVTKQYTLHGTVNIESEKLQTLP
jgi:hypothetical protein